MPSPGVGVGLTGRPEWQQVAGSEGQQGLCSQAALPGLQLVAGVGWSDVHPTRSILAACRVKGRTGY